MARMTVCSSIQFCVHCVRENHVSAAGVAIGVLDVNVIVGLIKTSTLITEHELVQLVTVFLF